MDDVQYKIIGGDGREYGPISFDELKGWIREGRVGPNTLIWRNDRQSWLPAREIPELSAEVGVYIGRLETTTGAGRPVGFGLRLVGYIIDSVVLGIIFSIVYSIWMTNDPRWQFPELASNASPEQLVTWLRECMTISNHVAFILYPIHFLYYVGMNTQFGATVGKLVIGARIVRLDDSPIGVGNAVVRWLAERLNDFICFIGYFFIAFRSDKRGLHDLLAGTCVIFKR